MLGRYILFLTLCLSPITVSAATILFLGDSLTSGFGVESHEAYPEILRQKLTGAGVEAEIINGGISGSTSAGALSRLKWYSRTHPDILFLALGANDGLRGLPTRELYANLEKTISYARKSGMRVILAGMEVPPNYGENYAGAFRKVYLDLKEDFNVLTIPFLLDGVAGIDSYNLRDGIHPNPAGHRKIAELVYPYVLKALDTSDGHAYKLEEKR